MKALGELEEQLGEDVNKASEQDLDQPEGSDLGGGHAGKKMSDEAPAPSKSKKNAKKSEGEPDMNKGEDKKKKKDSDDGDMDMEYKSFSEELPDEIQTKVDVSEFLKSLVDHTGEVIDSLNDSIQKSDANTKSSYDELKGAVGEIQKSQAKIGFVLKAICERIGVIENAPATSPKADTVVKSGQVAERQFAAPESNGTETQEPMFKSLNSNPAIAKSQISNAICELVRKGEAKDLDVVEFESSHYLSPELATKLKTVLN